MKIYKIRPRSNPIYASIHAQMRQPFEQGEQIRVTWNDYLSKGNLVPDFLYSSYVLCKREIEVDLVHNYSKIYIPILPQSTVIIEKRANGEEYIDSYIGVESIIGEKHILREKEKGIFIQQKEIKNFDFFRIEKSYPLLCTENVKEYIEKRGFSNVLFLEIGDVIEN